ncbi:AraC family transcriptional regulator [Sedimentitalea todarodis]|uniref:AraC family transcriptional regulator ligand-binding domain-containing protein n=1 Tax=Sedimentitalea todarodis TaxID=1631240 RepID=A0ABU3VHC9_9RHOB|nr:AraC family transcriptional regulator ligand-binding domain-containing protein [Sedimentitalea todarodis]MDU9005084.1 AraC family transcriptional regulator ligand-binding domain-containing protein [Sedimentitalea todarodis]
MPEQRYRHGAIYAKSLAEHLLAEGYSQSQVFSGTAFAPELLSQEKPFAEFPDIADFFEHAAILSGNDVLGFERGMERDMRRSGLLSYVGLSSPTVRDFIKNFARYRRVFTDVVELDEAILDRESVLSWYFRVPAKVERRQLVEFGASGILSGLEKAADQKLRLRKVCFRHLRKTHTNLIEDYLGCPVEFGAPENAFFFEPSALDVPLATADHELYSVLRQYAEDVLERERRNTSALIVDVERAIAARLAAGEANQDRVARALGFSSRTLARRLAQEGTTFFRTLRDLREGLAISYLKNSDLGLGEIAYLMGYSNLSSFTDAFKGWVGVSPGRYRTTVAAED